MLSIDIWLLLCLPSHLQWIEIICHKSISFLMVHWSQLDLLFDLRSSRLTESYALWISWNANCVQLCSFQGHDWAIFVGTLGSLVLKALLFCMIKKSSSLWKHCLFLKKSRESSLPFNLNKSQCLKITQKILLWVIFGCENSNKRCSLQLQNSKKGDFLGNFFNTVINVCQKRVKTTAQVTR